MALKTRSTPPPAMTWSKAAPAFAIAGIFDAVRLLFEWLGFLAPVLISIGVNSYLGGGIVGHVGAAVSGILAAWLGFGPLQVFGVIMGMCIGFLGWLALGFYLLLTNRRIFKDLAWNVLWLAAALGADEVPFLDAFIPGLTIATWRMYHAQIKKERAARKHWEASHAAEKARQRTAAQQTLLAQQMQEAANDNEIPEAYPEAA